MKKLGGVLLLCAAAVWLSGCAWLNLGQGPCYGAGCPHSILDNSSQATNTASASAPAHKWWWPFKKKQSQNAQAQAAKPAQPAANTGQ